MGTAETVTIQGTGFVVGTTLTVDGVLLSGGYTIVDEQNISVAWPLVAALGNVDVTVSSANGTDTATVSVISNTTPALQVNSGDEPVPVLFRDEVGTMTMASTPGDLFFLYVSPDCIPTIIPGTLNLDIGNNFTSLIRAAILPIGPRGYVSFNFGPNPGSTVNNATIYMQGFVIDLLGTKPFPASNKQHTIINP